MKVVGIRCVSPVDQWFSVEKRNSKTRAIVGSELNKKGVAVLILFTGFQMIKYAFVRLIFRYTVDRRICKQAFRDN